MAKASPRVVGAFVVGGIALLIGGILAFGSIQFLKPQAVAIMYFEEELSGLDVGAPVTFRGVQIGEVTDIQLLFKADTRTFQSPVHVRVEPGRFHVEGGGWPQKLGGNLPYFVEQGLRAQLVSQSVLTGKRQVELVFRPGTPVRLAGLKRGEPEVPTIPSQMKELQAGLEGLLRKLDQTQLPELVDDMRGAVQTLTRKLNEVEPGRFAAAADEASSTLQTGRSVLERVGRQVDIMAPKSEAAIDHLEQILAEIQKSAVRLGPTLASIQRAADRADHLLADANTIIEPGSQTHRELIGMMRDISGAARSMRVLTDDLNRDPNSLLFGKASSRGR